MPQTLFPTYWNRKIGNTSSSDSGTSPLRQWVEPAKVAGSWINYADGSRFRRPTDYSRSEYVIEPGPGYEAQGYRNSDHASYWLKSGPGGTSLSNFFSGNWVYRYDSELGVPNLLAPPSFVTMEENEANTKALNKLADGKANIGENLATLGQTVRLFTNPVQSYVNALRSIQKNRSLLPLIRRNYRELIRGGTSKELAGQYLAYVYGFKPLMQDIYGLAEMAKEAGSKPLFVHGKGLSEQYIAASNQSFTNVSAGLNESWSGNVTRCRTRTAVWAKLSDEYSVSRALNQLGLLNPASLIWELVPYSFLVDWVLPIGPVLQALTAPAGLDFVGGSTSRRVTSYWEYGSEKRPLTGYTLTSNTPAGGRFRYNGYRRKKLATWPRAGLYFDSDPLRLKSDGSDRVFKGLALAVAGLPKLR